LIDPPEEVEKLARKFASKLRKEIVQEKENETYPKFVICSVRGTGGAVPLQ
jgi:hypothetical protein